MATGMRPGSATSSSRSLGVGRQVPERGPDGAPRRVDPGDQDQSGDAEDEAVLEGRPVDFGLEELAEQVIPRSVPPDLQLGHEIVEQTLGGGDAALGIIGELKDIAHPLRKGIRHVGGDTQNLRDHPDGNLLRVLRRGVGLTTLGKTVEQAPAELAGEGYIALHPPVGKPGQQQPARPRVQRRVRRDRREAVLQRRAVLGIVVVDRNDRDFERAEMLDVMGDGRDVVVPSREPVTASPLGVGDRAAGAKAIPDAERIGDVPGVEDVEIGRPVVHRSSSCHGPPLGFPFRAREVPVVASTLSTASVWLPPGRQHAGAAGALSATVAARGGTVRHPPTSSTAVGQPVRTFREHSGHGQPHRE